ncbi:MAG TPA: PQQ-binding-like beta-propeller repeat protein [Pirellulales bacterium]|nr:PQQ-binding-like beta-propeller repeat protein [Pirellulales bacterium]
MAPVPRSSLSMARCFRLAVLLVLAAAPGPVVGQSAAKEPAGCNAWPAWRGAHGDGVATGCKLPDSWPEQPLPVVWDAPLEKGWSSPVVADGRVFVSDRRLDVERLQAFDAQTGRQLWQLKHPVDFDPHPVGRRHGNGPKSTPVVAGGRVYWLGIAGWLECVDARDGTSQWHLDLPAEFGRHQPLASNRAFVDREEAVIVPVGKGEGAAVPLFGYTGSPRVDDGRLICPIGQPGAGTFAALDVATGRMLWHALDEHVSYSSPIIVELAGVRQVVAMTGPRVVGLACKDGGLLWSHPFQIQYDESISTPVVSDDMVIVSGEGHPTTALKISADGAGQSATMVWENFDLTSYLSSMLAYGGHIYGMNDGGELCCVRASDGKTLWSGGKHGYYCTPLLADGKLLCLNERGTLLVVAADPGGYRVLGESQLTDAATWTTPALVGQQLFIRSADGLRCLSLARP